MKKHMTYFPELNIKLGLFAPMVVYNPIKPKTNRR